MPAWLVAAAFAADAREAYLAGLEAWRRGRYPEALLRAEEALAADPALEEAQLLRGYALLRTGRVEDGLAALDAVDGVDDEAIADLAREAGERWTRRRSRDELALSAGQAVLFGTTYGRAAQRVAWVVEGRMPVAGPLLARAEVATPWGPRDDLHVVGPRASVLAEVSVPLGAGGWRVDVAAGPSLWVAVGDYWPSGSAPYVGGRAAAGVDVRASRRVGFRLDGGGAWYPEADRALPFYEQHADVRAVVTLYPTR
jgi:hypothetical protein